MSHTETLETRGGYRARLVSDDTAEAPDFFAGDPILDTGTGELVYGGRTEDDNVHPAVAAVVDAFGKVRPDRYSWHGEWDTETWERYVRVFHGGTVTWVNGGMRGEEGRYAAVALPAYRRAHGVADEHLTDPPFTAEWSAFVEGDVWGVVVERSARFAELDDHDRPILLDVREEWVEVDSCWGFYGRESAEDYGREQLDDLVGEGVPA